MIENKYKFQKLTPVRDADLRVYENSIDYIFSNPDIRNIAISGAYGAGKSSVLESYKDKHPKLKFLHISLAHFKTPDQEENEEVKESVLEGKILNQLIHQISASKIPQTNFRVKKKIKTSYIIKNTLVIMMMVLSIMHIWQFKVWSDFVSSLPHNWIQSILNLSTSRYSLLVSGLVCIILLNEFIFELVKIQKNKNVFRKFNVQGNEIEIFEDSDESYFDKYLNEVLYLFENVSADVIVFEDIDRFNANRIFERLREINILTNIQLKKENKKPIKIFEIFRKVRLLAKILPYKENNKTLRFFYLLRDDIFVSKDRTKFFDFIMPVVPVVDSSNSYDQFIGHFKEGGIFDKFEESFLQGLSLYVDDMRILKNIYNEFIIYYNRLNTTELDCNKMLALIVYKNLFPKDFSELQLNKGLVFTLFDKKEELTESEINKYKQVLEEKNLEIKSAKEEHLVSIEELEDVYKEKWSRFYNSNRYNHQLQEEKRKEHDSEKATRIQAIQNRANNLIPALENEATQLRDKIVLTKNKQLKDLITRRNIDSVFKVTVTNEIGAKTDFNEVKGSEYFSLLKYLIRNGYIDETYNDYMTYFYENSLSRIDKTFLRSITDEKSKEYTYRLKNPKLVVDRLRIVDFDQEEVLNFDLLEYLLKTPKCIDNLDRILLQLKEIKNLKFIGAYFDTEKELPAYVRHLNLRWPELFSHMVTIEALTEEQIRRYSICTIYYSDDNSLQSVNTDNKLSGYIANCPDYLTIENPDILKLIHGFELLGVSFIQIDYDCANKELFDAVYENSLYELNFDNLALMLRVIYRIESESDIQHRNYTLILMKPDSPLSLYVKKNISAYIEIILSNSGSGISDDENAVLSVLNDEEISTEQKINYIKLLQTPITLLSKVEDTTLWDSLLERRLAKYSEENIIVYFNLKKYNSTLIQFINSGERKLDFTTGKITLEDERSEPLFDETIICDELANQKYKEIVCTLDFYYENFNVPNISDEKLRILVDKNILHMTPQNLQYIRGNYPDQVMYFIENNIQEYTKIHTNDLFSFEELTLILLWDIVDEIKLKLLTFIKVPISINKDKYSVVVNEHILCNNLDVNDLPNLFATYEKWDSSIQQVIYNLAIQKLDIVTSNSKNISDKLTKDLISSNDLVNEHKINLFISFIPNLGRSKCKEYMHLLGLDDYAKIFVPRSRTKYEITSVSEKLLTAFKNKEWIESFEEAQDKPGYYKIIKRKAVTKTLPSKLL
ncbi:hypothetical protein [uncultured Clostridium sp.]|uniref:YobI family P-loop NTPase n=1 Tax=uncultured Clostridium sp. TaxID=59620 RepID=UPI003217A98F